MTEIINIKGCDVEISVDVWAENPRNWGCTSSTLCTAHRKYDLGGIDLTANAYSLNGAFKQHLQEQGLTDKDIICRDVYLYDHGGFLGLSTEAFVCSWDSGQLGYIYEKRSDIRQEFNVKRISPKLEQQILNRLDAEINELGYYYNGEVYSFSVAGESYGGFYGYNHEESGLIAMATETVDAIRQQQLRQHINRLKRLIKAGVGLEYRPALSLI
ncbi:MAG: hypothetical protein KGV56_05395 [Gammaproteobacteria bacterium]|nr:hypothetical protein [Gammaproteobacteria bacterium]